MDKTILKIGLIGAGVFGGYHANKLAEHPACQFMGIYDRNPEKAVDMAAKHHVTAYREYEDLFHDCDAVVIACSASEHGAMAMEALKAECHILIEKPIATDMADAETILAMAEERGLFIQVGHQERFVAQAIGLDKITETPTHIIALRHTPYSVRGTDTSVTLDLMTHDIDLCCYLMKGVPLAVSGTSTIIQSETPDRARAELSFSEGTAILSASRVEESLSRQMTLKYPSGTILIDFVTKTLQHNTPFDLDTKFSENPMAADSLGAATASFIAAISSDSPIVISGQDGLNAARIALQIDES